ncbi:hypothetical protein MUK42_33324, partial [Musa troglodytarum]
IDVYSTSQLVCETQATKKPRAVIINTPVPSHGGGRAIATHLLGKECFHIGSKVVKEGTWGGNAGNAFDTGRVDRFTKVKIYHGDVIYGLEITFVVGGKTQRPMVIGEKKRTSKEITLNEDEHFTSIKGYFKAIEGYDISITQLTLTTDKGRKGKVVKEGPWGANVGKPFDTGIVDRFINVKIYHEDVITLGEDEHFTSISGYFKSETDVYISQLTLTTDMNSSISAGKKTGKAFCLTLEKEITLWASLDVINRISPWMPLECTARWLIPRYGCTSP